MCRLETASTLTQSPSIFWEWIQSSHHQEEAV